MGESGSVGSGLDARALAERVAARTGATITWGQHGEWEGNLVAGDHAREPLDAVLSGRVVYVLPATLERLGVAHWLPRSGAPSETAVMHVVADGRSVLIGDETLYGGWSWARDVRPVVELSTYLDGLVLRVWTPQGHKNGGRNRWRSAAPDLEREWWRPWPFGSPTAVPVSWSAALETLQGERRLVSTIRRVFDEIGLGSADADKLDALSGEAWSESTAHEVASVMQLPAGTEHWLKNGPPPTAEPLKMVRVRPWTRLLSRASMTD